MSSSQAPLGEEKLEIGKTLGPSRSILITQEMINQFAETTQDLDPMHIDPEWSREHGPYPTTISFGFLTMSFLTALAHDLLRYDREGRAGGGGYPLNFGFNKIRFISPVPVNSKISATLTLLSVEERKPGQSMRTYRVTMNIEGQDRPALVGEWLAVWVSE